MLPSESAVTGLESTIREWIREATSAELRPLVTELALLLEAAKANDRGPHTSTYLTAAEAAAIAKVRPATVRSWVSRRLLPGHQAGRKLRIRLDELESFMSPREKTLGDQNDDERVREILRGQRPDHVTVGNQQRIQKHTSTTCKE